MCHAPSTEQAQRSFLTVATCFFSAKFCFKSHHGRYLTSNANGILTATKIDKNASTLFEVFDLEVILFTKAPFWANFRNAEMPFLYCHGTQCFTYRIKKSQTFCRKKIKRHQSQIPLTTVNLAKWGFVFGFSCRFSQNNCYTLECLLYDINSTCAGKP